MKRQISQDLPWDLAGPVFGSIGSCWTPFDPVCSFRCGRPVHRSPGRPSPLTAGFAGRRPPEELCPSLDLRRVLSRETTGNYKLFSHISMLTHSKWFERFWYLEELHDSNEAKSSCKRSLNSHKHFQNLMCMISGASHSTNLRVWRTVSSSLR